MALPDGLEADRHRDLARLRYKPWVRRAVLAALVALCALALANVFGQRSSASTAREPTAELAVDVPARLRGGVLFEGRIETRARARIAQPRVVLGEAWVDGITINTISPQPATQGDDDGALILSYDEMAPGDTLTVYVEMQVNPTTVGRLEQDVELRDGDRVLARIDRTLTVFP